MNETKYPRYPRYAPSTVVLSSSMKKKRCSFEWSRLAACSFLLVNRDGLQRNSSSECRPVLPRVRARFFSNFFLPRDARHYDTGQTASLLCLVSKYLPSIFSMGDVPTWIPPFSNLFPLYRETVIESTQSVGSSSLPARSRKTRHFYAISCEVYLGRILILHCNLVFHVIICSARTSCVTMIGEILTNGESCLCGIVIYNYTKYYTEILSLFFCYIF